MAKMFTFTLIGDVEAKLQKVRTAAPGQGVNFQGNEREGTFDGLISGTYQVEGNRISINVTNAPIYVTWATIEDRLRKLIEE